MALDAMLAGKKNREVLVKALEKEFREDPVRFFRSVIMPLLPKESKLEVERGGILRWRSLLEAEGEAGSGGGDR